MVCSKTYDFLNEKQRALHCLYPGQTLVMTVPAASVQRQRGKREREGERERYKCKKDIRKISQCFVIMAIPG